MCPSKLKLRRIQGGSWARATSTSGWEGGKRGDDDNRGRSEMKKYSEIGLRTCIFRLGFNDLCNLGIFKIINFSLFFIFDKLLNYKIIKSRIKLISNRFKLSDSIS